MPWPTKCLNKIAPGQTADPSALQGHSHQLGALGRRQWVTDALKREFKKRKIELIPIQAGADQMVAEMGNADGSCVEVVVGGHHIFKHSRLLRCE